MIPSLIQSSTKQFCFVHTFDDELIPVVNCKLINGYIVGVDHFNYNTVKIEEKNIQSTLSVDSDNKIYQFHKKNYDIITKAIQENGNNTFDSNLLYKTVSLSEKIISILINKNFNEITLGELKEFWKKQIIKHSNIYKKHIFNEINRSEDTEYISSLNKIIENLQELTNCKDLDSKNTIEEVQSYWPSLLLPYPNFVKHDFNHI